MRKKSTPAAAKRHAIKRLCFDIETESFSNEFRLAPDNKSRALLAPRMRIACVFDEERYNFYVPSEVKELIRVLNSADEIISFNGKCFDELVLRKHYSLKGLLPKRGKHFDLCELFQEENGYFVSLDALAKENLNEKKHTSGRAMALLDLEAIQVACKSDVSQTYRLWELWHAGKLKVPSRKQLANVSVDAFVVGAGDHMPTICPYCHSSYSLELIDQESSEMSEGEESDYLAGLHGQVFCTVCKNEFDYGY